MGALDTLIKLTFSTLLAKRFIDWDAFKMGLIDKKGNKLRDPKTREEKSSLTTIKNLVRKVKRTLVKFMPDTPTVNFLLAATLLKESQTFIELNLILTETEKHYFNIYLKDSIMKSFNEILNEIKTDHKPSKKELDTWYVVEGNNKYKEFTSISKAKKYASAFGTVETDVPNELFFVKTRALVVYILQRKNFKKYSIDVPKQDYGTGMKPIFTKSEL